MFQEAWERDFVRKGWNIYISFPNFTKNITSKYYNDFTSYFQSFTGYDDCEIISTEEPFLILLTHHDKTILFNGILDAVGKDDKGLIIWDSKSKGAWKNADEINDYFMQLYTYALYIKETYGEYPYKLSINQFRMPLGERITDKLFDMDTYDKSIEWIFDTVNKIDNENLWLPEVDDFYCKNLCNHYPCEVHETDG